MHNLKVPSFFFTNSTELLL